MKPKTLTKRIPVRVERPNLRWIESKLGESLQTLPQTSGEGVVRPKRDTSVIPMGEHCYYPYPASPGYAPCPYFKNKAYGTTVCRYVNVEAYDRSIVDLSRGRFKKRFGSLVQAKAAGLIEMFDLPDSIKICGVNMLYPSTWEFHLEPAIQRYEQSVNGRRVDEDLLFSFRYATMQGNDANLQTAALDRFTIWERLCSMIEPVPPELVDRIQVADAIFRGATRGSKTAMSDLWSDDLAAYPDPKKQFWYFYRQDFDNPLLGADRVSWLPWAKGAPLNLGLPPPTYSHVAPALSYKPN